MTWSRRVIEEFWRQGDLEQRCGVSISPLCDRRVKNVAKSQEGFLKAIVLPLYESLAEFIGSSEISNCCVAQVKANTEYWTKEAERENEANGQFLANTQNVLSDIEDQAGSYQRIPGDNQSVVSFTPH
eukprot:TRINITY_DN14547_c0_g1_i2.p1 TRINITY_DN14547_c0_g1~~TRINITY_DN14547_c0_g1_i2.p1  ORF type:complete len:128 (-),score=32.39 TRINITY_DN14547_c0_g1_i2:119-502(-)